MTTYRVEDKFKCEEAPIPKPKRGEDSTHPLQILDQLERLEEATNDLGNAIASLESRLDHVSSCYPPDLAPPEAPRPELCQMADRIQGIVFSISGSANRIFKVITNLEL